MIFFALISPLPVMIFFPRVRQRFWLYVFVQLVFGLLFAAANIAADSPSGQNPAAFRWLAPFPTASLMAMLSQPEDSSLVPVPVQGHHSAAAWSCCAFTACYIWREFRLISQLEQVALGGTPEGAWSEGKAMSLAAIHQRMKAAASVARLPLRAGIVEERDRQRAGARHGQLNRFSGPASLHARR